jgi:hypothetical protein
MTRTLRPGFALLLSSLLASALVGCNAESGATGSTGATTSTNPTGGKDDGFVSDNPDGSGAHNKGGGDAAAGTSTSTGTGENGAGGASQGGDAAANRAIAEADIVQVKDGKLYALSQYSGLSIIDISQKDHLKILGRWQSLGQPFEMYLRDGMVYAEFNSWGDYIYDDANQGWQWVTSSRIEALDVTNPADIKSVGSFKMPGILSDSRTVGDVLYAVTYEDGYCWNCKQTPNTTVTSLAVADPKKIHVVDQLTYTADDPNSYGWWKKSITVNQARMYVAGVEWNGQGEGHSTIQVVDISDPGGKLVQGAEVQAAGQIDSRWQMDEYQGVLRVVSQPGMWWQNGTPIVQTFSVKSSFDVQPLAHDEAAAARGAPGRALRRPARLRDHGRAEGPALHPRPQRPEEPEAGRLDRDAGLRLLHRAARRPALHDRLRPGEPGGLAQRVALRRLRHDAAEDARARELRR